MYFLFSFTNEGIKFKQNPIKNKSYIYTFWKLLLSPILSFLPVSPPEWNLLSGHFALHVCLCPWTFCTSIFALTLLRSHPCMYLFSSDLCATVASVGRIVTQVSFCKQVSTFQFSHTSQAMLLDSQCIVLFWHTWVRCHSLVTYLVILIINPKPFPEISEHQWTIFLKFEATWQVLPRSRCRVVAFQY